MKVTPDGDLVLHQSDIGAFVTCPDQFRVTNGIQPGGSFDKNLGVRVETDAATIGTVTHSVIEHELTQGRFANAESAIRWAKNTMGEMVFGYVTDGFEYRTESYGDNPNGALKVLEKCVRLWWNSQERRYWLDLMRDHPNDIQVEWNFEVPFISGRKGKYPNIRLAGTADILDTYGHRIVDWKTASRKYERWEKQRWAPQPTVYTFAAAELGLIQPHEQGYRFDYRVFNHKANDTEPQAITVYRDAGQWGFLVQKVSNMVDMIESNLENWPLRDDHALCGPKWCPVWDQCKGQFVSHPEWT